MRKRRSTERRQIKVKVIRRAGRGEFVFRWTDPRTGQAKEENSGIQALEKKRRTAERAASTREEELQEEVERQLATEATWDEFLLRYTQEHMSGLAVKSKKSWQTTVTHVDKFIKPRLLGDITASSVSKMVGELRKDLKAENTIASYLRTLRAGLNWAARHGLVEKAPTIGMPPRARGRSSGMRSRPITGEEFERMLAVVPKLRDEFGDTELWQELLSGLWWSGLRISEALRLSWDWSADFSIQFGAKFPVFKILAEGEKGHSDRLLPVAPEFARQIAKVPEAQRKGRVFKFDCSAEKAGPIISAFGEKAGIIVSGQGKFASAHDLRRSFGTRWATRLTPIELKELMRHKSIETTLKYYVQIDAEKLGKKLQQAEMGDILGDTAISTEAKSVS